MIEAHASAATVTTLTFSICGLEPRDETLFKSFVRLIAHRTNHHWVMGEGEVDVCVATVHASPDPHRCSHVLWVGKSAPAADSTIHTLSMPFRADELEQRLNKLGEAVTAGRARRDQGPLRLPAHMRLVRWPPVNLLRSPDRMRLATVMTGRFLSLGEVHKLSGVALETCDAFARDLLREGYLAAEHQAPPRPARSQEEARVPVDAGLLAQIRNRLRRATLSFR